MGHHLPALLVDFYKPACSLWESCAYGVKRNVSWKEVTSGSPTLTTSLSQCTTWALRALPSSWLCFLLLEKSGWKGCHPAGAFELDVSCSSSSRNSEWSSGLLAACPCSSENGRVTGSEVIRWGALEPDSLLSGTQCPVGPGRTRFPCPL